MSDFEKAIAGNIRYYVAIDESEPGRGGAKLARMMGWKPERCRALMKGQGKSATMDELAEMAARFGIPVEKLCEESPGAIYPKREKQENSLAEWEFVQAKAFGRDLARALWESGGDSHQVHLLMNEPFNQRKTHSFWTYDKLLLAARYALDDLASAIELRYPVRDKFPLRQVLPMSAQILGEAAEPRN